MSNFENKPQSVPVAQQQQVMRLGADGIIESVPCSKKTMEAIGTSPERMNRYINALLGRHSQGERVTPLSAVEQQRKYLSGISCYHCLDEGIHMVPMRKPQGVYEFGVVCDCQSRLDKPKFKAEHGNDIAALAQQGLYQLGCKMSTACAFEAKESKCSGHICRKVFTKGSLQGQEGG